MSTYDKTTRFDEFYIKEDHSTQPKEYFKKALEYIKPNINRDKSSILDIGCAAGDFLRYVKKEINEVNCNGLDAFSDLISEAKTRVPSGCFYCGDMNVDELKINAGQFDVVTMLGVLSIFSSEKWIKNFAKFIKPDGMGLIFGMINPYPYDVFVRLRNQNGENEYGWNSWSSETLKARFLSLGFKTEISYWSPPIEIPQREDEPLRSWSTDLINGEKIITNGSRMIHDFAFAKITKI